MKRHSLKLQCLPNARRAPTPNQTRVTFLTGNEYWWQTIWCAQTLLFHAQTPLRLEIVDDGSLPRAKAAEMLRLFPHAEFLGSSEVTHKLAKKISPSTHPLIWHYREVKPIFRKLPDIFGRDDEWRMLLDSDMLFFSRPEALLNWLETPAQPAYMVDVKNAYGYSPEIMQSLSGGANPEKVNIGMFGFKGELVDWDRLETWIETLVTKEGLRYNLTQALSAMHLVGNPCTVFPAEDYLLLPTADQAQTPEQPLQHYVAESKEAYFRFGWRAAAKALA